MPTTLTAAGFVIFRIGKEYMELLLLRHEDYWGFPKGHQKQGETLLQTAMRELEEETGLDLVVISDGEIGTNTYVVTKQGDHYEKTVHYYAGIVRSGEVSLSDEHRDFKWVHRRAAQRLIPYEGLLEILDAGIGWLEEDDGAAEFLAKNLAKLE